MADMLQTQCVNLAGRLVNLSQALRSIREQYRTVIDEYNKLGASTVWAAMATAALNADGSLGAVDATPNTAHPITVGNINHPQTDLVNGINMLNQLESFWGNAAVTTGDYAAILNKLAGA